MASQVTGVDRTAVYLRQARERAAADGLDVEFVQADMRDFLRSEQYDIALSLYTTFGYFQEAGENARVLRHLFESLRSGGALMVETMGKEVLAGIFQARNWREKGDILLIEERVVSRNWSWMDLRWTVITPEQRIDYSLGHWIYSAAELLLMLRQAGFADVAVYGGLDGRPYDTEAVRLVAVARKA